ncbi:hypothetical protein HKD37_01G001584 [Glycine soja]
MADRGRGGGRRTFNRGRRRGLSLGAPITTNPSTSSIHVSTSESMIHVVAPTPNTLPISQDQPNPTFVRELIPTTPIRDVSSSAPDDSLTPEYPPDSNCEYIVDQRLSFMHIKESKFQPTYASWLKVSVDLRDRWFGEFKSIGDTHKKSEPLELFLRQKIRNGQDKGKWITSNVRAALDKHWGSTDFLNKRASTYCCGSISIAAHFEKLLKEFQRPPTAWKVMKKTKKLKSGEWVNDKSCEFAEKYQHHRDEILQHSTEEGTSTQDSPNTATFVNDNEIYMNVVGGPNYKENVYGLGTLSKRFSCSKSVPSTSIAPVENQIEEMRETINKLNAKLLAKENKEKTLEEKMLQLMENHNHQSQKIVYYNTIANGKEHHVNDAQVDRPHDMGKDHRLLVIVYFSLIMSR